MPSKERLKVIFVDDFLKSRLEEANLLKKTISKYRTVLTSAVEALDSVGLNCYPRMIGKDEILYLRQNHFINNSPAYDRWKLSIFGGWLSWYDNRVLEKMKTPWPQENRINVDWLSPEEAIRMKRASKGIENLIIHFELDLGLRRSDMYRLKMTDVHSNYFDILGKGRAGGKKRTISWDEDTQTILNEYFLYRNQLIEKARRLNPKVVVPDGLLIYLKGKRLGQYQMTAIDNMVVRVSERAGIGRRVTNHTLRRTCGRLLHLSGVEIEEIASILGHTETRTTLRYLGIRLDDQKKALAKRDEFLRKIESEMVRNVS
jgi:integrase